MAFTSLTQVNTALPGQSITLFSNTPISANIWSSTWMVEGFSGDSRPPTGGLSGDIPDKNVKGVPNFVNPASGETRLGRLSVAAFALGGGVATMALYDRLWHNSSIDATVATPQTIDSVALTRPDASGVGVEAWWETYLGMGPVSPTLTLSYTDQGGVSGVLATSGVLAASMPQGRTGPFQLAAGDTGVRSIQTFTSNASFIFGRIGLVMRRNICYLTVPIGPTLQADALSCGLPRIYDNACLEVLWFVSQIATSVTLQSSLQLSLIQG